jgi:hypothetical protein
LIFADSRYAGAAFSPDAAAAALMPIISITPFSLSPLFAAAIIADIFFFTAFSLRRHYFADFMSPRHVRCFLRFITLFITLDIYFDVFLMSCFAAFALLIQPPFSPDAALLKYASCRFISPLLLFAIIFDSCFFMPASPLTAPRNTHAEAAISLSAIISLSPAIFAATRRYFFRPRRFHLRCAAIWLR